MGRHIAAMALLAGAVTFAAPGTPARAQQEDANSAACANANTAGFRAYLPDCRSYELVSPPYKADDFVAAESASLDEAGPALVGESIANFANEAPNAIASPLHPYLFQRGAGGWTTAALISPEQATALQRPGKNIERLLYRHRDLATGEVLWTVLYSAPNGEIEPILYIQRPDGSFSELGPMTPGPVARDAGPASVGPAEYAVTSRISHVVFPLIDSGLTPDEHWPGDTTRVGAETLYEYAGPAAEPKLVAVTNEGRLVSNAEAQLISSCGAELGASFGDKRHALANEGRSVIFTVHEGVENECAGPPVEEIYARIDGQRTVAISEPSAADCAECNTSSGLQAAVFQGASADGTLVYFTTAQELLPGATGPNLYVYDFAGPAGHKLSLVSAGSPEAAVQGVSRISEDGTHVYFVATGALAGANGEHSSPQAGEDNLYLFERDARFPAGRIAFLATLAGADAEDWEAGDFSRPAAVTPSGRYLVLASSADLTPDDTSSQRQLFEYDAESETLTRISVGQRSAQGSGGFNHDGNGSSEADRVSIATSFDAHNSAAAGAQTYTMSDDGRTVFFQTPLGLTPQAADNVQAGRSCSFGVETETGACQFGESPIYARNTYEYHWSDRVGDGNVYLISGGRDASAFHEGEAVRLIGTDPSATDVFFTTTEQLAPEDGDSQVDIYDARVLGGFLAPPTAASCGAAPCEGSPAPPPTPPAPASASWPPGENVPAPSAAAATIKHKAKRATSAAARAKRLARALKACRKQPRARRHRCEAAARRRFAAPARKHRGANR